MMQTLRDSSEVKGGWSVKASRLSSGETTESEEITGTTWTKNWLVSPKWGQWEVKKREIPWGRPPLLVAGKKGCYAPWDLEVLQKASELIKMKWNNRPHNHDLQIKSKCPEWTWQESSSSCRSIAHLFANDALPGFHGCGRTLRLSSQLFPQSMTVLISVKAASISVWSLSSSESSQGVKMQNLTRINASKHKTSVYLTCEGKQRSLTTCST